MQAGTFTFEEIFTENKIFNIPFFQRSYVWDKEQWERCIEDTINSYENNHLHFMGALIFKQFPITSLFAVIDGQQHLTTLLILLKVLADKSNTTVEFYKKFRSTSGKPVFKIYKRQGLNLR